MTPPLRFTISLGGDVQLDRTLEAVAFNAENVDAALHDVAGDLRKTIAQQFASQGRSGNAPWPALNASYLKQKARMVAARKIIHGRPARYLQILRLTDRLRLSLVTKDDPEHVETIVDHVLTFGTRVPYAAVHQNPKPGNPLPRRRPIDLTETKRQAYLRALLTHIRTGHSGL